MNYETIIANLSHQLYKVERELKKVEALKETKIALIAKIEEYELLWQKEQDDGKQISSEPAEQGNEQQEKDEPPEHADG